MALATSSESHAAGPFESLKELGADLELLK
jgi:hypothetical protein